MAYIVNTIWKHEMPINEDFFKEYTAQIKKILD